MASTTRCPTGSSRRRSGRNAGPCPGAGRTGHRARSGNAPKPLIPPPAGVPPWRPLSPRPPPVEKSRVAPRTHRLGSAYRKKSRHKRASSRVRQPYLSGLAPTVCPPPPPQHKKMLPAHAKRGTALNSPDQLTTPRGTHPRCNSRMRLDCLCNPAWLHVVEGPPGCQQRRDDNQG